MPTETESPTAAVMANRRQRVTSSGRRHPSGTNMTTLPRTCWMTSVGKSQDNPHDGAQRDEVDRRPHEPGVIGSHRKLREHDVEQRTHVSDEERLYGDPAYGRAHDQSDDTPRHGADQRHCRKDPDTEHESPFAPPNDPRSATRTARCADCSRCCSTLSSRGIGAFSGERVVPTTDQPSSTSIRQSLRPASAIVHRLSNKLRCFPELLSCAGASRWERWPTIRAGRMACPTQRSSTASRR